jgi:hypothetical protein
VCRGRAIALCEQSNVKTGASLPAVDVFVAGLTSGIRRKSNIDALFGSREPGPEPVSMTC